MNTIAEMTKDELIAVIEQSVERKLLEILGDPDDGLEIRQSVQEEVLRQKTAIAAGEKVYSLEEVLNHLQMG